MALAQDEVPFITTPDRVTLAMLTLAGVGQPDHLIDLGSGDGRIVITAARRFGASGLRVEIVPNLVQRSRAAAQAAGVAERVSFLEQDLFRTDLSRASVVSMYLLPEVNLQLRPRPLDLKPGTRIVSHVWHMGDWRPDHSLTLEVPEKATSREKKMPQCTCGWCLCRCGCRACGAARGCRSRSATACCRPRPGAARPESGLRDGPAAGVQLGQQLVAAQPRSMVMHGAGDDELVGLGALLQGLQLLRHAGR